MSGICPPSKPGRVCPPERAVCPLPPRPAVLPIPEPGPRPLRMRARCDPAGARRPCSRRRSTVTGLAVALAFRRAGAFALVRARPLPVVFGFRFVGAIRLLAFLHRRHLDEVAHLIEHAAERGVILLHHGILVMLEPERLERPPFEALGLKHRSEEHTSELQSQSNLVCRLLLEKKKKTTTTSGAN